MAMIRREARFRVLTEAELKPWKHVSAAVTGDAQNRSQCMSADVKPLRPGLRILGQARTVQAMVGDNSAVHAALALIRSGEVLVIEARGHVDTALWGQIMTIDAQMRGLAVVPLASLDAVLSEVRRAEAREAEMLEAIRAGKTSAEIVGVTVPPVTAD